MQSFSRTSGRAFGRASGRAFGRASSRAFGKALRRALVELNAESWQSFVQSFKGASQRASGRAPCGAYIEPRAEPLVKLWQLGKLIMESSFKLELLQIGRLSQRLYYPFVWQEFKDFLYMHAL